MRDVDDSNPDDFDPGDSPAGLGPGDSLSPLPPRRAAEMPMGFQYTPPSPPKPPLHPAVKYGGIGGLLAFLGALAWYLISWFAGGTRP
jgi:hypothetical protein